MGSTSRRPGMQPNSGGKVGAGTMADPYLEAFDVSRHDTGEARQSFLELPRAVLGSVYAIG